MRRGSDSASSRSFERDAIFDPLHYLALIEQKINALDQAAPSEGFWADLALGPPCSANASFDQVASESGPSEAPAPKNSKTQRHDEIIVLAQWRGIKRRAARPCAALHC
jgi:hypothetical protein